MKKAFPLKQTLMAIACIIAGSFIYYRWGYKDNVLIKGGALFLSAGGWLSMSTDVKKAYVQDKNDWYHKISINLAFGVLILMNLLVCVVVEDNRVNNILKNGKTKTTIAIVTELEDHRTKGGIQHYAIINYAAGNDNISEHISNSDRKHVVGERLEVKYAVDYPDMFEVMDVVSGQ